MNNSTFDRTSLRLSGTLLLVGQLLYVVVTLFHTGGEANNHHAIFAAYAESAIWTAVHVAQFACMAAFLGGLFALSLALDSMPYVIGIVLLLSVALFARAVGFDRDRAFYPTVLMVIASYYVLFAVMSGSMHTVLMESIVMTVFAMAAVAGFKSTAWIVVA